MLNLVSTSKAAVVALPTDRSRATPHTKATV